MTLLTEIESAGSVKAPEPLDVAKPEPDDERFYSTTTIIGCLEKPALMYWSAEEAAKAAVAISGSLAQRVDEDGEEAVVKWLRDARFRQVKGQRTAAELGTACHDSFEEYALTGVKPTVDEEVQPYLDQFDKWVSKWQPEYLAAELSVYNRQYGYAGTTDAFIKIQGTTTIADYKTSRKSVDAKGKESGPYPEVGLQLASYRYAELAATWRCRRYEKMRRRYYLLSPDEAEMGAPVPVVDGGLCIHVSPQHCHAYVVRCDEEIYESFLYLIEAFRYTSEVSKTIIGARLVHESEVLA